MILCIGTIIEPSAILCKDGSIGRIEPDQGRTTVMEETEVNEDVLERPTIDEIRYVMSRLNLNLRPNS